MVFNSIAFLLFFGVVFFLNWFLFSRNLRSRNLFLLAASYFFYGYWDWRFLVLLIAQSILSFFIAKEISQSTCVKASRNWLILGVGIVLIVLGFYKYFNFFSSSFAQLFQIFGLKVSPLLLNVGLPLGISFYSFKILAYLFDVYRQNLKPEECWINYSLFVSFFPQLIAGPIERAQTLLPQIKSLREFDYSKGVLGLKLILWGMFKKVVVADNCATYVADIFGHPGLYNASTLLLGTVYFAFQVYADFSGYSDMAVGFGKLLGFDLMKNFDYPFSSKNITEFWRRWHISLGTWFNDYVFTPLFTQFRHWGNKAMYACIVITFLLSGLWHGPSWHFVFFGLLHGSAIALEAALKKQRKSWQKRIGKKMYDRLSVALTFLFLLVTWIYFRADNMLMANKYLAGLFSKTIVEMPQKLAYIPFFLLMVAVEYWQKGEESVISFTKFPQSVKWAIYLILFFVIAYYFGQEQAFYYFRF